VIVTRATHTFWDRGSRRLAWTDSAAYYLSEAQNPRGRLGEAGAFFFAGSKQSAPLERRLEVVSEAPLIATVSFIGKTVKVVSCLIE
jgi:hypothetical protein